MYAVVVERPYVTESKRNRQRPKRQESEVEFPRVASALRKIRKDFGLTQEAMAPILGLSFAGYRPYERGERDLTQSQMEMIATELKVPVSEVTRRLWPDDVALIETRFSADWESLQREVADLPQDQKERVIRGFRTSVEIALGSDLARKN